MKIIVNYNIKGTVEFPIKDPVKKEFSKKEIKSIRDDLVKQLSEELDRTLVDAAILEKASKAEYKFTKLVVNQVEVKQ